MHVIAPEMLAELRELPMAAKGTLLGVGIFFWTLGWWCHRFWVVTAATVAAGVAGLRLAPDYGVQPVVAALLSAVAAGMLALALVRVAVFAGCGIALWYYMQTHLPEWTSPLICVSAGGLLGAVFFRFWIILVTTTLGMVLTCHGGLLLIEASSKKFDAVAWATDKSTLLNVVGGVSVFLGLVFQYGAERLRKRFFARRKEWMIWRNKQQEKKEREKEVLRSRFFRGWWPRFRRAA
jgi:hypothetical protein